MTSSHTGADAAVDAKPADSPARGSCRWPDFFIIGAAKSGTTTLHDYLTRHPALWMSAEKEPGYFDPKTPFKWRDRELYLQLFEGADASQLCGESSTAYSEWPGIPDVPRSIHAVNPRARFIYLLREPIKRCYSHFIHRHRYTRAEELSRTTFEDYLARRRDIADASDYAAQVQRYLEYFPKESLLLLPFERFVKEPAWALREVFEFLGVEDLSATLTSQPVHSNSTSDSNARIVWNRVVGPFRRVPGLQAIYRSLPPTLRAKSISLVKNSVLGRRAEREITPKPMLASTRERLQERFDASTEYLVKEFGFDPSWWVRESTT